jgi:hypothetical protein
MRKLLIIAVATGLFVGAAMAQETKDKQAPKPGTTTTTTKTDPKKDASKDAAAKAAAPAAAPGVKGDYVKRGGFGLGLYLGQPMSLSAKVFINRWNAIDMGMGYWLGAQDEQGLSINADYVFHWRDALMFYGDELPITAGVGVIMVIPQQQVPLAPTTIRIRMPVGLAVPLRGVAMELGAEVVPMYHVYGFDNPLFPPTPEQRFTVSAAGFVRFYF